MIMFMRKFEWGQNTLCFFSPISMYFSRRKKSSESENFLYPILTRWGKKSIISIAMKYTHHSFMSSRKASSHGILLLLEIIYKSFKYLMISPRNAERSSAAKQGFVQTRAWEGMKKKKKKKIDDDSRRLARRSHLNTFLENVLNGQ